MDNESKRVLEYLTEIEEAAEDVLSTKQQVRNYSLMSLLETGSLGFVLQGNGSNRSILAGKLISLESHCGTRCVCFLLVCSCSCFSLVRVGFRRGRASKSYTDA